MRIAFVGKGGGGKSTACALFCRYLLEKRSPLLAIDADINVHLQELLGAAGPLPHFSDEPHAKRLKEYLWGTNSRILSASAIIKTTPPGTGSSLIALQRDNYFISNYTIPFGDTGYIAAVGTYEKEGVGTSCYHNNISVFENILSHSHTKENEWILADMTAGTDAFSNTLHVQFDALILIVEPTKESTAVFSDYLALASAAGVSRRLLVIGNKIENASDAEYISASCKERVIGFLPSFPELKKIRREGGTVFSIPNPSNDLWEEVESKAVKQKIIPQERLSLLYSLHKRYAAQEHVIRKHGNLSNQIDPLFSYPVSE